MNHKEWLEEIYLNPDEDKVNFLILEKIDELLSNKQMLDADNLLQEIEPARLAISCNLAFLYATLTDSNFLPSRRKFLFKVENDLIKRKESSDRIEESLDGLKG